MAWLDPSVLRTFVKNTNADDEAMIALAVDVGCGKVEELCGPIANTTVTETVTIRGDQLVTKYRATALTAIATESGTTLTTADWVIDGQLMRNKAGTCYTGRLTLTYTAGYFDATNLSASAPAWARSAALYIGQQHMRTLRRFGQTTEGPQGFLVPAAAMEEMKDYLLTPGGFA